MSDDNEKTKMVEELREAFQRLDVDLADGKAASPRDLGLVLRALVQGVTEGLDQMAAADVRAIVREELDAREGLDQMAAADVRAIVREELDAREGAKAEDVNTPDASPATVAKSTPAAKK